MNIDKVIRGLNKNLGCKITRREFIRRCLALGLGAGMLSTLSGVYTRYSAYASIGEKRGMREALFYESAGGGRVRCNLCPVGCVLKEGQRSFCRVREPVGEKLYTLVYGLICAMHIDPVEKKPMFHVLPGSSALSVATAGCNSRCKFCQNWTISQRTPEETANRPLSPDSLIASALRNNCRSIAYTYNEPVIFYEYMVDASERAAGKGIKNIMVTGGKINPAPMKHAAKYVDAANVDLKGFDREYLEKVCAQDLDNILEALTVMKKNGMWVEITNLIVPTLNDNMEDIRRMAVWIRDNLGADTPLHFTRFWPQYKLRSLYPTPVDTLMTARGIAMDEGLHYVYVGNVPGSGAENTLCPQCGKLLIERKGYMVLENNVEKGSCRFCGQRIPGIWS